MYMSRDTTRPSWVKFKAKVLQSFERPYLENSWNFLKQLDLCGLDFSLECSLY